jgi:manganese/zinc/iron transport system permease protein
LFDVSISGMMATMTGVLFLLALLFSPSHGLAAAFLRRSENRRVFSRDLLLSRIGTLGEKTTEETLARSLGWEEGKVSRSLEDALREGFIVRPSSGEVAVTRKGCDAARERTESLA